MGANIAISAAIAAHLQSIEARGFARSTLSARRANLRRFEGWCTSQGAFALGDVTTAVLEAYRLWLHRDQQRDGRVLSASSQANVLTAVRMLFAWATRAKLLVGNPAADLELPRMPRQLPRAVLSISEVERVLAQPDVATVIGLRDRAMIEVLYSTGVRRMELLGLDVVDIDAERGTLFVREGKGRKDRLVPIGARAIRWVEWYRERVRPGFVKDPDCGALFLTTQGQRLRPSRLTERMHRYIQTAGVNKPGSVHIFRHTMATLMHDAGADIRDLQEILGHALLSTTAIYTRVSIERLKAVHAKTHPARMTRETRSVPIATIESDQPADTPPDSSVR